MNSDRMTETERELAEAMMRIDPTAPDCLGELADGARDRGDLAEAERHARMAVEVADGQPNRPLVRCDAYILLGEILLEQGSSAEAETCLQQARDLAEEGGAGRLKRSYIADLLGKSQRAQGNDDEAAQSAEQAETLLAQSAREAEFADLLDRLFHGEGESTPPLGPVEVSFLDKVEELSAEKGPLHPELAFLAVREEWDAPDPPDLDDAYDVLRAMDQQGHLENRPVASTGAGLRGESAYLEPYYLPARSRPEVFAVTCGDLVRDVLEKGRPVDTVIAYAQSLGVPPELIETVKRWLRRKM